MTDRKVNINRIAAKAKKVRQATMQYTAVYTIYHGDKAVYFSTAL